MFFPYTVGPVVFLLVCSLYPLLVINVTRECQLKTTEYYHSDNHPKKTAREKVRFVCYIMATLFFRAVFN